MIRFSSRLPLYRVNIHHMWMGNVACIPKGSFLRLEADCVKSSVGTFKCNPRSLALAIQYGWIVPFWKYGKVAAKKFYFIYSGIRNPPEEYNEAVIPRNNVLNALADEDRQIISLTDSLTKEWLGERGIERVDIPGHGSVYIRSLGEDTTEDQLRNFYADKAKLLTDSGEPLSSDPDEM